MTVGLPAPRVLVIAGATATGKTGLALALAERRPVTLISADAAQVYRRMDIGTAKPDAATLARHPHQLVNIREPHEGYSAAEFRHDATRAIEQALAQGRLPVVVGGTLFYVSALLNGLSEIPRADDALRAALLDWADAEGWMALHRSLASIDPALAARIDPADRQRLQRAHEIHRLTGRVPSQVMRECAPVPLAHRAVRVALFEPGRARLHRRIAARFHDMLESGLVDEVAALRADPRLHADSLAMRTVGYRQAWQHLDGRLDRRGLLDSGVAATRQLAKRQLTWLRGSAGWIWLDGSAGHCLDALLACLDGYGPPMAANARLTKR